MADISNQLKSKFMRQTDARDAVLAVFNESQIALAHADVEGKLVDKFDRVTLYRTLKTFVDNGLIHKVLDDIGGMKYALCKKDCDTIKHIHKHDHVHFKCIECGQTTCLDDVSIPTLELPAGYNKVEMNLLVQGTCIKCN